MTESAVLPVSVHVFVRDWLSANHVLLRSRDDGHVQRHGIDDGSFVLAN